jgi:hypothetical protein
MRSSDVLGERRLDALGEVVRIHHDRGRARCDEVVEGPARERPTEEWNDGLGQQLRQRPKAGTEPSAEHHRSHRC